jgi:F1F0 ATPase subunit 2
MNDVLALASSLLVGAGLGLFYYGGLWLTVQRLSTAQRPGLLALGSFWVRTVVTVAALYLIMDGHWQRLAAALVGFVIMRVILVGRLKPEEPKPPEENRYDHQPG